MIQRKGIIETCVDAYKQFSFLGAYNKTFELARADTPEQKEIAYRLRHEVYCEENQFESALPWNSNGLEYDAYDERSVHYLLMRRESGDAAGTLRIILPDDARPSESFPIQKQCRHPVLHNNDRVLTLFEISRFCMAKRFRKRENDGRLLSAYYDQDVVEGKSGGKVAFFRRRIPYAPAALLRGAFETALNARIMEGVWMVDPVHMLSLERIGFEHRSLGPHVSYHGGAQPVIFNIKAVLDAMRARNPHCWDVVSDSGRLQEMADDLCLNDWSDALSDEGETPPLGRGGDF